MNILIPTNNTFYCKLKNEDYINILELWLSSNEIKDINHIYTPFYVKRAYEKTKVHIKDYIKKNTNKYIDNLDIDDVFYSFYYKYNIDCVLWFPFVKIYRCYICLNNNNIIMHHYGYNKYILKKGDIIGLDYNRDYYKLINNDNIIGNDIFLRFNYITYDYGFMYYYIILLKRVIKFYENNFIKYHLKLYFKNIYSNDIENINDVAYISTKMFAFKIYNYIELYIGFKNIFIIYFIYNIFEYNRLNKYIEYDMNDNKFNNYIMYYKKEFINNIDVVIYTPLIIFNIINIYNDRVSIYFILRNIFIYSMHLYYLLSYTIL